MTRAGSSALAAFSSSGWSSRVRKKIDLTLVSITLSHPASEYSAIGAPHAAPALLTRTFRRCSRAKTSAASAAQPAAVETSPGIDSHPSSFAAASHAVFLRADTYTLAPDSTKPRAIIIPIPREPPVINTVFPLTEKRSATRIGPIWLFAQDTDVAEVAIIFGIIQTIAHHEFVGNLEPGIVDLNGPLAPFRFIQQRRNAQRFRFALVENFNQIVQRHAAIDDVFHHNDVE